MLLFGQWIRLHQHWITIVLVVTWTVTIWPLFVFVGVGTEQSESRAGGALCIQTVHLYPRIFHQAGSREVTCLEKSHKVRMYTNDIIY